MLFGGRITGRLAQELLEEPQAGEGLRHRLP
jgi:hypothetical protein